MKFILIACLVACVAGAPVEESNPMLGEFFGGDMLGVIDSKGVAQLENYRYKRWPNGRIPYTIDSGIYTSSQIDLIVSGMRKIESQVGSSCIRFVPRTYESTYIKIEGKNRGCYSWVGQQQSAGPQVVSLSTSGCVSTGIIIHELLHAVGFHHEQNRPDRDNYITVNFQNIRSDMAYNFDKLTGTVDTQGFPYDYYSIMHYEDTAFSMNGGKTMVPKQAGVQLLPAYRKYSMTTTDVAEVRKWYGCKLPIGF